MKSWQVERVRTALILRALRENHRHHIGGLSLDLAYIEALRTDRLRSFDETFK